MACFGELNEPSSRAFCDFEEELGDIPAIELHWEGNQKVPERVPLLLFADGTVILDLFQKSVIQNAQLVCQCKENGVKIYRLNNSGDKYVCLLNTSKDLSEGEVIESINPWITAAVNVVILHSAHMVQYQTKLMGEKPECLLRMLQYSSEKEITEKPLLQTLEQPNIVTGKAAAVISYRMYIEKPATLFVCYLDIVYLDSISAKPVLALLNQIDIPTIPYIAGPPKLLSNLYM